MLFIKILNAEAYTFFCTFMIASIRKETTKKWISRNKNICGWINEMKFVIRDGFTRRRALGAFRFSLKNLEILLRNVAKIKVFLSANIVCFLQRVFILWRRAPGYFQKCHAVNSTLYLMCSCFQHIRLSPTKIKLIHEYWVNIDAKITEINA